MDPPSDRASDAFKNPHLWSNESMNLFALRMKELVHFVKKLPEPNSSFTHKTKLKLARYDYLKLRKKLYPELDPFHQP